MKRRRLLPILVLLCCPVERATSQTSADWQQRVQYDMEIVLHTERHQMDGHQVLRYENHSPDTLRKVFYHLYFNAFHPHSMMAERNRRLPDPDPRIVPQIFELGPDGVGYHTVQTLTQDGKPVGFDVNDTVMEVRLVEPILPGKSAVFEMSFRSQVPLQTRRSGRDNTEGIDYSMSQWYPKMANYDERGWHVDPYVGREFYAPFGTFDVRITLPSEYVIGATGVLQNPDEIGHGYSSDSVAATSDSLTWHFRAEDVHDFAWAADPDFIHDVLESERGTTIHLLYQPEVAESWERLQEWAPMIMDFYSRRFGPYPYPQVTVAQAGDGGMEYPMITFVTGRRSPASLRGVTAHEVGHMWYYGVLGSNEGDYAWMDEGFTSYAETEFSGHLEGNPDPPHTNAAIAVLQAQHFGLFEPLNRPADWYRSNFGYSIASYAGGETLLEVLGYVISDSLRDDFLLAYFDRFKFRHPNPYDVEEIAEDVSGLRLDWYFDQFAGTTWELDYAVNKLRTLPAADGWNVEVVLERESDAVLPVDLQLTLDDGSEQWVNVPLSIMNGHKPVPEGWIVAEPWRWTSAEYTLRLTVPARVIRAEIDPKLRTPDTNRLNNADDVPLRIALLKPPPASWTAYNVGLRPLAQYAYRWGAAGGIQLRGTYLFNTLRTQATIKAWPELLLSGGEDPELDGPPLDDLSAFDGVDFAFNLSHPFRLAGRYGTLALESRKHLGILENEASFSAMLGKFDLLTGFSNRLTVSFTHQAELSDRAAHTAAASGFESANLLSGGVAYRMSRPALHFEIGFEVGGTVLDEAGARSANRAYLEAAQTAAVGPFAEVMEVFVGTGAENLAGQKLYRLGAATFEDSWGNDAFRSVGAAFEDPLDDVHWVAFAGPGPVAYARRPHRLLDGSFVSFGAPAGRHLVAASARLLTSPPWRNAIAQPLRLELFAGAGDVWHADSFFRGFRLSDLLMDAGFGIHYDVSELRPLRRWTAQSDVLSGLKLGARFPLWANKPALVDDDDDPFAFRWLLGVTADDNLWN